MKTIESTSQRAWQRLVCILFAAASGCAHYHAQPLTTEFVEQRLATPDEQSMRIAAARLRHPVLRPLDINLQAGVSPDEVAVLAVIMNPSLRAERDRRAVADAQVLQAGLLPNPQLVAGIDKPYSGPDDFTAYNVGADWDITSLIGRKDRRAAATAEAESVELDIAWKEWQTAEAAKAAAYDVLGVTTQLEQLRQIAQQTTSSRDLLRRAVESHERTITDLAAAEAAADDAHQAVVAMAADRRRAVIALNRAVGLPADAELRLRSTELSAQFALPRSAQLVAELETRRLDLLALKKGYDSQDATLRAAILAQFPKATLGFNAARDTSDTQTIGLGATIDIPLFDRNQGAIATETATRQKLFDEYAVRVFEARSDLASAAANIESINEQLVAAEAARQALDRLVSAYQQAEKRGDMDAMTLYSAQNTLLQKRLDISKLNQQLMQNWVALELASGQFLPRNPTMTRPSTQTSEADK